MYSWILMFILGSILYYLGRERGDEGGASTTANGGDPARPSGGYPSYAAPTANPATPSQAPFASQSPNAPDYKFEYPEAAKSTVPKP